MKGSRPFCVSLLHGLGRDSMSLTLPWDSPSTWAPRRCHPPKVGFTPPMLGRCLPSTPMSGEGEQDATHCHPLPPRPFVASHGC